MIEMDGSFGEGGGQIVRSSLALAALTGQGLVIDHIRAKRSKPGLMRQHLVAVRAAAEVCGGALEGDELGSTRLVFEPGEITSGYYDLPIGTAGSTSLVMQTVLMPLLHAKGPSTLMLGGGTHNPLAPPFEFLRDCYLPRLAEMGAGVTATMHRAGYFPVGGGRVEVMIDPPERLQEIELMERGERIGAHALIRLARLPDHIAQRQAQTLRKYLPMPELEIEIDEQADAQGPGNAVVLTCRYERTTEVFTAVGRRGLPAEQVAQAAIDEALEFDRADAPVGEHLADQLMLPLALAGRGRYRAACSSGHTETHAELIHRFLSVPMRLIPEPSGAVEVVIG